MMGILTLATILLFASLRTDLMLTDREAYGLFAAYLLFIVWVVAETVGITHLLRGA